MIAALLLLAPLSAHAWEARPRPGPLPTPAFELPSTSTHTLSNGLEVLVAEDHEVPLFGMALVFRHGAAQLDPGGKEGLASCTLDMMNEGAGSLDAEALSARLNHLASSVGASAGEDGMSVFASGLSRNLQPTLDLWVSVLLEPTFPDKEWDLMRAQRLAALKSARENPRSIAARAQDRIVYGSDYRGKQTTEGSLGAITTEAMRAFHAAQLSPARALLLVGGDVDADTLVPMLEARLAGWTTPAPSEPADGAMALGSKPVVYVVDKPGAAQSELVVALPGPTRLSDDYWPFRLGVGALGGMFTARVNMNLREGKGWSYGAYCRNSTGRRGAGLTTCSTSVQTDKTVPSLVELRRELADIATTRPVTAEELSTVKGYEISRFPGRFEQASAILDELEDVWRWGLPADWVETFVSRVSDVDLASVNKAVRDHVAADRAAWLVVGDRARFADELAALGLPVVELDRDGNPVTRETP